MSKPLLIVTLGPTGSGKSSLPDKVYQLQLLATWEVFKNIASINKNYQFTENSFQETDLNQQSCTSCASKFYGGTYCWPPCCWPPSPPPSPSPWSWRTPS